MNDAWERIATATVELVGRSGYVATSLDEIVARAGVDRAEFDRLFSGKEDCFLQVWDRRRREFQERVAVAFESREIWREQIGAAGWAALRFLQEDEARARFLALEPLVVGETVGARLELVIDQLVDLVDAGRQELEDPDSMSRSVAEGVVGAFFGIALDRIRRGQLAESDELIPELIYMATRPYLGDELASAELRREGRESNSRAPRGRQISWESGAEVR